MAGNSADKCQPRLSLHDRKSGIGCVCPKTCNGQQAWKALKSSSDINMTPSSTSKSETAAVCLHVFKSIEAASFWISVTLTCVEFQPHASKPDAEFLLVLLILGKSSNKVWMNPCCYVQVKTADALVHVGRKRYSPWWKSWAWPSTQPWPKAIYVLSHFWTYSTLRHITCQISIVGTKVYLVYLDRLARQSKVCRVSLTSQPRTKLDQILKETSTNTQEPR